MEKAVATCKSRGLCQLYAIWGNGLSKPATGYQVQYDDPKVMDGPTKPTKEEAWSAAASM